MFNCCAVNTARSYGRLEKCINCRMNCGWIHCIRKPGNYPVCHDSLSVSNMGNRVHLNRVTHALTGWKYPLQNVYFTFRCYFPFPKAGRKIGADPCISCLLCLSSSMQGMGHKGMWCPATEATKCWLRQHRLGLPISTTHGNWKFFWIEGAIPNSALLLLYRYSGGLESLDWNLRTLNDHNLPFTY